jgi:hypothetical protein
VLFQKLHSRRLVFHHQYPPPPFFFRRSPINSKAPREFAATTRPLGPHTRICLRV